MNVKFLQEQCFKYPWAYLSHDVPYSMIPNILSPQDCQAACQKDDRCHYWTLYSDKNNCYFKDETAFEGGKYDPGKVAYSGPKNCPLVSDCYYHDIGFTCTSSDISVESGVSGAKECQTLCQAKPECEFWTYKGATGACRLKDQSAFVCGSYSSGKVSGPKNCP